MDDILEFVGEFFKCMIALIIIGLILLAIARVGDALFGGHTDTRSDDSALEEEFAARCESVSGTRSSANCYKDGEIIFSK